MRMRGEYNEDRLYTYVILSKDKKRILKLSQAGNHYAFKTSLVYTATFRQAIAT